MRDPECYRDCKHRPSRVLIQRKYRSSEVNKNDCNSGYRSNCSSIIYDKTYVQSKAQTDSIGRQRWSHQYLQATGHQGRVSLNIIQKSANKFGRKIGFKIENEIEDQNQSYQKFRTILTLLRCIFGLNLVILACTADELWCTQTQNSVKFDFQVEFDLEGQNRSSPKTIGT